MISKNDLQSQHPEPRFYNMLQLMEQNRSQNLIIDLRGNDGGFTPITLPTLYQLWGNRFIEQWPNFQAEFLQVGIASVGKEIQHKL